MAFAPCYLPQADFLELFRLGVVDRHLKSSVQLEAAFKNYYRMQNGFFVLGLCNLLLLVLANLHPDAPMIKDTAIKSVFIYIIISAWIIPYFTYTLITNMESKDREYLHILNTTETIICVAVIGLVFYSYRYQDGITPHVNVVLATWSRLFVFGLLMLWKRNEYNEKHETTSFNFFGFESLVTPQTNSEVSASTCLIPEDPESLS